MLMVLDSEAVAIVVVVVVVVIGQVGPMEVEPVLMVDIVVGNLVVMEDMAVVEWGLTEGSPL